MCRPSAEFKAKAVLAAMSDPKILTEIAIEYRIHPTLKTAGGYDSYPLFIHIFHIVFSTKLQINKA
jgi:hypothetical protein